MNGGMVPLTLVCVHHLLCKGGTIAVDSCRHFPHRVMPRAVGYSQEAPVAVVDFGAARAVATTTSAVATTVGLDKTARSMSSHQSEKRSFPQYVQDKRKAEMRFYLERNFISQVILGSVFKALA